MEPIDMRFNRRVRHTNEELLAGKCFPDDMAAPLSASEPDHRFKSPDFLIEKNASSKSEVASFSKKRIAELEQQIKEMLFRHNSEMEQWKEYARRVTHWQLEVAEFVKKLKAEAEKKA